MPHGFHSIPSGIRGLVGPAAAIGAGLLVPGVGTALGLSALGTGALGAGVGAGIGGLSSHSLKGALLGGLGGGLGSYFSAGGDLGGALGGGSSALGGASDTVSPALSSALSSGSTSDVLGAINSAPSGLGSAGGFGSLLSSKSLAPVASTGIGLLSNATATDQLTDAQKKAMGLYNGIANEQFNPGDLSQTPGYQFQLQQGQQALDRKAAAGGDYYSGAALKDAAGYSQGLSDSTYQQAQQNFLATQGQKLSALSGQANIQDQIGQANATGTLNAGQLLAQGASGVLGGASGNYYNPTTGQFYNPNSTTGQSTDYAALLKKLLGQA